MSVLSGISEKKSWIHVDLLEQLIDVDNNRANKERIICVKPGGGGQKVHVLTLNANNFLNIEANATKLSDIS